MKRRVAGRHTAPTGAPSVLERDHEVAELVSAIEEAAAGTGSVVLVSGEAGIGKSSLVHAVPGVLPPEGRLLVGYCDDLATPRTHGPFRDLAGSVGVELSNALRRGGDRDRVFDALHTELSSTGRPTVLAVEDAHWADDATLDALCYLVRRMADLPAVLVVTYRDDDVGAAHPLQRVLGQAARASRVRRLGLERLSEAAVRQLAATSRLDPGELYVVTAGNPFFVTEVLAAGDTGRVPPTIVDAVLARVRRLDVNTRAALEQLAVVPSVIERRLLDSLLPDGIAAAAGAEERGLLDVTPTQVTFHHELIRRAIADSLPVARRVELNQRVLDATAGWEDRDLSRIMHHAERAGDVDAVVRYGPQAAHDAVLAGAHREAAAHLRLVLEHRERFEPAERADLLGNYAIECYTVGDMVAAVSAQQDAVDLRRTLDNPRTLGADLRWLSRLCWSAGEPDRMQRSADEAVAVLEAAGDDRLLALALATKSQLHMLADRNGESIQVGERAIALARAVGDAAITSHALNSVGSARWHLGDPHGRTMLEESLRIARTTGAIEDACRAYANITYELLMALHLEDARRYLTAAIDLAEGSEHLLYLYHFYAHRAALGLATGAWDEAISDAELAVQVQPLTRLQTKYSALAVLGRIQVRRGRPDGAALLSEAWEFAVRTSEPQHMCPIAAARAEAAWLRGDQAAIAPMLEPLYADACRHGAVRFQAELAYWLTKAGQPVAAADSHHPYSLQASGRWRDAAEAWRKAGCPYEHAAALAESQDPGDLLAALATLDRLGAEPLARLIRRRLRSLGVASIPRGPVATTRDNVVGLTERQLEVARLVADGLTNAEIAEQFVVSVRTIESHVAAMLEKLDVRNRRDVAARIAGLDRSVDGA
jgi:DNA-binding CsgD family transcriptional regulator/tetratricopeptide (TPR) repeat protein/energy-coupling factor transporter ATP-binding protein EcfA2